jgi:hypothetical protein
MYEIKKTNKCADNCEIILLYIHSPYRIKWKPLFHLLQTRCKQNGGCPRLGQRRFPLCLKQYGIQRQFSINNPWKGVRIKEK